MIQGLHHITVISSSAQKVYNFYTQILGLRFIKKTVNFDAPDVYHLYFGDEIGTPGSALTFFPFPDAGQGRRGAGHALTIGFQVPKNSLGYWFERLVNKGVKHEKIQERFGEKYIRFYDQDGLQMELIGSDEEFADFREWKDSPVPVEHQIRGFHSVTLGVEKKEETEKVLTELLEYEKIAEEEKTTRYKNKNANRARYVDILDLSGWPKGLQSAGIIHHVAFAIDTYENQTKIIPEIEKLNLFATNQIDRNYFHSVYFREPNGVLFEIATLEPGFTVDEKAGELGKNLKLPAQYEERRREIEAILPNLRTEESEEHDLNYEHKFVQGKSDRTLILFHGTGGDENDLIPLALDLDKDANILSLRGKENENGALRFFKRNTPLMSLAKDSKPMDVTEEYDQENIHMHAKEIAEFIHEASKKYNFDLSKTIALGFSNGANMIASLLFLHPYSIQDAVLIKAKLVIEKPKDVVSLEGKNILLISATHDEFFTVDESIELKEILQKYGANIKQEILEEGHQLSSEDIEAAKDFIKDLG